MSFARNNDAVRKFQVMTELSRVVRTAVIRGGMVAATGARAEIRKTVAPPNCARPYLERMKLDHPRNLKERLYRRALVYALAPVQAI